MKILMTGATGLVGKFLGVELVRRGHEIIVISRSQSSAQKLCPFPCRVIEATLTDAPIASELLNSVDAVINLMGEPIATGFWTAEKKQKIQRSRIEATKNLVNSFTENKPKIFLSTSAIGIYGDQGDELLTEESKVGNGFLAELCRGWEKEAQAMNTEFTRLVIARIGLVLSSKGGLLAELLPLFKAGLGGSLGSGDQWMSWIHIDDLISSFIFALENPNISGVFNAVAPNPVRNKEFTRTLAQILKRPRFAMVPKVMLQILLQEKSSLLTFSQRVLPKKLQSSGYQFQHSTLEKSLNIELKNQSLGEDVFVSQHYIESSPQDLFPFFSEAKNLEQLTPQSLRFKILKVSTALIEKGTLIDYSLRIHGVPVYWRTEIENWNPPFQFVDNQLRGPYKLWHHTHSFELLGKGTLMTDRVRIIVPFGFIGWFFGNKFIRSEVESIFSFRRDIIHKLYHKTEH